MEARALSFTRLFHCIGNVLKSPRTASGLRSWHSRASHSIRPQHEAGSYASFSMISFCAYACVRAPSAGVIVNAVEFPTGLITAST